MMMMMACLSRSPTAYHSLQRVIIIAVPRVEIQKLCITFTFYSPSRRRSGVISRRRPFVSPLTSAPALVWSLALFVHSNVSIARGKKRVHHARIFMFQEQASSTLGPPTRFLQPLCALIPTSRRPRSTCRLAHRTPPRTSASFSSSFQTQPPQTHTRWQTAPTGPICCTAG